MSKPALKRPVTPSKKECMIVAEDVHWSHTVYECVLSAVHDGKLNLNVQGGSDNGEFAYVGPTDQSAIAYHSGERLEEGDIILEIQGQRVAGYTQRDIIVWLSHCSRSGSPVRIRAVKSVYLTKDLRQFLNTRFQKGSSDHDLQNTIRDNLYLRTVPCTTRPPRDGEVNGVDYTFLTPEEFMALERSGNLLESGVYEGNLYGTPRPAPAATAFPSDLSNLLSLPVNSHLYTCNHYGTPKPPKDSLLSPPRRNQSIGLSGGALLPGAHPSSEGKRRRNRSNVEAMAAKLVDPPDSSEFLHMDHQPSTRSSTPMSSRTVRRNSGDTAREDTLLQPGTPPELGPLPENWEKAFTENGEPYYIDHNTGTSQWLDPRMARIQKKAIEECDEDELPYGWERIDDPHYGTYYIDHVNRRTQYENPVLQAKRTGQGMICEPHLNNVSWRPRMERENSTTSHNNSVLTPPPIGEGRIPQSHPQDQSSKQTEHQNSSNNIPSSQGQLGTAVRTNTTVPYIFTRNPEELQGECIRTTIEKSPRGFGFTIVGGDEGDAEEFLQIKSVVPNGPAWMDGKLQTGDVLVFVNNTCVLGYSHQDVVSLFQSIPPGDTVHLEVCRGYPLPFDPNDPNTEIVTTVAVSSSNTHPSDAQNIYSTGANNSVANPRVSSSESSEAMARSAKSMPDLSNRKSDHPQPQRHNSADLLSTNASDSTPDILDFNPQSPNKPEFLTVEIVKGNAGFGFTIADSAYGQKVKKILDRPRCKSLQEGDILVEINGQDVRGLPHGEVVQVLKDCTSGEPARITVQRGGMLSPRGKGKSAKFRAPEDMATLRKTVSNGSTSQSFMFNNNTRNGEGYGPLVPGAYRSKTPTADLYSSREKEVFPVNRPKTPLVDTRNWLKTSSGDLREVRNNTNINNNANGGNNNNQAKSNISHNSVQSDAQGSSELLNSTASENHTNPLVKNGNQNWGSRAVIYNTSVDRTANSSFYGEKNKDPAWLNHSYKENSGPQGLSDTSMRGMYGYSTHRRFDDGMRQGMPNHQSHDNRAKLTGNYSFDENSLSNPYMRDWHQETISGAGSGTVSPSGFPGLNTSDCEIDCARTEFSRQPSFGTSRTPIRSSPYQHLPSPTSYGQYTASNNAYTSSGSMLNASSASNMYSMNHISRPPNTSLHESYIMSSPHQDFNSSYYNSALSSSYHSAMASHSPGGSYYDSLSRRKHSTSFEHEQPVSSTIVQGQKDARTLNGGSSYGLYGVNGHKVAPVARVPEYMEMTVTLQRQESGFGFRIVGGTEEGSQVSIGHIVPSGAADQDGRLCSGDEIVSVDGQSVLNTSHHHVVQLMGHAAANGRVTLGIRRRVATGDSLHQGRSTESIFPYEVTVTRKENEGFGFVIISSVSRAGLTIGRIIENSPAERCGQLHVSDRILAVNGISILNMHHSDIVNLIKDSGYSVTLTIGPPQDDTSSSASTSQRGEEHSLDPEEQYYAVELHRGTRGFGFSIRGGREFQNMPLFVLRIAENGPASQDARLQVGDQIIEINGINTKNMTHAEAIEIIRQGGNSVRLLVKRGGKIPPAIVSADQPSPLTPPGQGILHSVFPPSVNGPLSQSSPRSLQQPDHSPRDPYSWMHHDPH